MLLFFFLITISSELQHSENQSFLCNSWGQLFFLRFYLIEVSTLWSSFLKDGFWNNYFCTLRSGILWYIYLYFGCRFNQIRKCQKSLEGLLLHTQEWQWGRAGHLKIHLATSQILVTDGRSNFVSCILRITHSCRFL